MQKDTEESTLAVRVCHGGLIVALAALWEIAPRQGWCNPELVPPLSVVMSTLWRLLQQPNILMDLRVTFIEIATAFAVVVPVGLLLGFWIGERPNVYRIINPTLQLLIAMPKAIFLPIFIIAFGISFTQRILFAAMVGLFITILYGITAVQSVPQGLVKAAVSFGASTMQLFWHIYLPAMTPLIISGIRMAMIFTIFGVLLSEMYASNNGFGRAIFNWGESFRIPELFAGVLVVIVFSVTINQILSGLETYFRGRYSQP